MKENHKPINISDLESRNRKRNRLRRNSFRNERNVNVDSPFEKRRRELRKAKLNVIVDAGLLGADLAFIFYSFSLPSEITQCAMTQGILLTLPALGVSLHHSSIKYSELKNSY